MSKIKEQVQKIAFSILTMLTPVVANAIPAFPGAEGGGAISQGGRGGRVIAVTSLADSGPGTLRACVQATGPRICVFKVAGDIKLTSAIYITQPYLTVAGQTAPGGGIQISGMGSTQHMIVLDAHDVVWQYTKIRKGYNPNVVGEFTDGANFVMFSGAYNVMVDHNSIQWNQDEGISAWSETSAAKNISISNNLIAEGLYPHSTGALIGSNSSALNAQMTDIDFYNNLTMNNSHRNPLLTNRSSRIVNNLTYNYAFYAVQAGPGVQLDVIGNKFKFGPLNATTVREVQLYGGSQSLYISGNVGYFQPNQNGEQWVMVSQVAGQNGTDYGNPAPLSSRRLTRLPDTRYPITIRNVDSIEALILPQAGASRRLACDGSWVSNRDSVDLRLINQYQTNTGVRTIPRSQADVGGFPVIASGTPCADADNDGMPDQWESARGLNPNSSADASTDRNGDGFSNIEEYLAGNDSPRDPASVPSPTPSPYPAPSPTPSPIPSPVPSPAPAPGISNVSVTNDSANVYIKFSFSGSRTFLRAFLDTDRNTGTGYAIRGIGANYLVENGNLYQHSGTGNGWSFNKVGTVQMVKSTGDVQFTVTRSAIGSPSALNLVVNADNDAYSAIVNMSLAIAQPSPSPAVVGTVINNANVQLESGNAYVIYMTFPTTGDTSAAPRQSRLQIYENGVALGPAHTAHVDIRTLGRGRFSHWGNSLRFSASDNTNPKTNGRVYTFKVLASPAP